MKVQYNHNLKDFSRQLRNSITFGEVLLWKEIKTRKLGFQSTRQKPIGRFIVDFYPAPCRERPALVRRVRVLATGFNALWSRCWVYCSPLKLAIEIDGSSHDTKFGEDVERQQEIEKLGITFLRFTEQEIRKNLEAVVHEIRESILKSAQPPLR